MTDQDGGYQVPWLDDGAITVTVSKSGFTPVTKIVTIRGNTRMDFRLIR